jgi:hypothetical protein
MHIFFRKKLSVFSNYHDWNHSNNYIAKRYVDDVPMARYFDDVMMQMTTKLWATYYNQHNPPKKVIDYRGFMARFLFVCRLIRSILFK